MSTIYDTSGYVTRSNGQTAGITLPKGVVVSARGRLRGRRTGTDEYANNEVSDSGAGVSGKVTDLTAPAVPAGYAFQYHYHTAWFGAAGAVVYSLNNGLEVKAGTASTAQVATANETNSVGTTYGFAFLVETGTASYAFALRTYGKRTTYTQSTNPSVSIGGVTVLTHAGELADGVETDWQNIDPARLTPDALNTFLVSVSGSEQVDIWIEVEMLLGAQAVFIEPTPRETVVRDEFVVRLSVTLDADSAETHWFPRVMADRGADWDDPEHVWDSTLDRTGWAYHDGADWLALPVGGAPVASPVRLTPPEAGDMATVRWYLRADAYTDETGWGEPAVDREIRLTLYVGTRYTLEFDGVDWTGRASIRVILATDGEISSMELAITVPVGDSPPGQGTVVDLGIRDTTDRIEQVSGWVFELPELVAPRRYIVRVGLGDSILAHRVVTEDSAYPLQDVGLNVVDIIDDFCTPLDSSGVNTSLGVDRAIDAFGRTALDVLREVFSEIGVHWGVDDTVSPKVVWAANIDDLENACGIIARGREA